jgi:hypothetical protein
MLCYVIDGDCTFAMKQLDAAIKANQQLGLSSGPSPSPVVAMMVRFLTGHVRLAKGAIDIRHALIPFPAPVTGQAPSI